MKAKDKLILLALAVATLFYLFYVIRSILTPFVISLVLSYFLHPLVEKLSQKAHISRISAILLIMGLSLSIIFAIIITISPLIYMQLSDMLTALPRYFVTIVNDIYPRIIAGLNNVGIRTNINIDEIFNNEKFSASALAFLQNFSSEILTSSVAIINVLALIFITPILIFYLLKDWDLMVKTCYNNLPKTSVATLKKLSKEIDTALAGYVRGQGTVCFILAVIYSVSLSFTDLNFGFLIGLLTGVFAFIPYIGAVTGVVCAIIIALFQWGFDFVALAPIFGIFLFGQILESNFLTPKLVGEKVGLHPVWIIFGIFVFGVLFGFVGVLFATPLTAIFGVLIKHFSIEYKKRFV